MKKIISISLALIICIFSITSCNSKDFSVHDGMVETETQNKLYNGAQSLSFSGYTGDYVDGEDFMPELADDSAEEYKYTDRKIIYTSSFQIQTTEFEAAVAALDALCSKYGAYYQVSETYGDAQYSGRNGRYEIRVPVENYKDFRTETGKIGTVVRQSEQNDDITERYFDTEARLESAKIRESRLLDILKTADTLDNILLLEAELADVRYEIESYSGTLRKYDSLVSYSTISVNIAEVMNPISVNPMPKTFSERLGQSVSKGFDNFVEEIQDFVIEVSYNLPGIIIFVIIISIIVIVIRRAVFKMRKKQSAEVEQKEEKEE